MRRAAKASSVTDLSAISKYLATYPGGRYATEIEQMRDDRVFEIAKASVLRRKNVTGLTGYLGNRKNVRHRDEALKLCAQTYEEALQ